MKLFVCNIFFCCMSFSLMQASSLGDSSRVTSNPSWVDESMEASGSNQLGATSNPFSVEEIPKSTETDISRLKKEIHDTKSELFWYKASTAFLIPSLGAAMILPKILTSEQLSSPQTLKITAGIWFFSSIGLLIKFNSSGKKSSK